MNIKDFYKNSRVIGLGLILLTAVGCEREISDQAVPATFSTVGDVFLDNFVGMGNDFYLPFADSKQDAFSVDEETGFESRASYRLDVPNNNDPNGTYAGAILRVDGAGRDLTDYDALTFYAKASQGVTIGEVGFGQDFIENKYRTQAFGLSVDTGWKKFTIPIPDASKLDEERGLFSYAVGTQTTNGAGFTVWFDEIKFETLGTVAQERPAVFFGEDLVEQTFTGSNITVFGLTQTWNLANGQDQTVFPAPAYYQFSSSNPSVATVDEIGQIEVVGEGTAVITATINGGDAAGSLTLESLGDFVQAPTPDRDPENVIAIFSDAYTEVPVDYYNGFFLDGGQTTLGGSPPLVINGEEVINYINLNFVGIGTFLDVAPVDATEMTHFHVDINVQEEIDPNDRIVVELINNVGDSQTSGRFTIPASELESNDWGTYDIPLGNFPGLGSRDALGLILFITTDESNTPTVTNIYVDNMYYYKEVVEPTDPVDDSSATQAELPLGFESTSVTYNFVAFEGAESAIEPNPDQSGINPTATIMRTTKTVGAQFFAGTFLDLDAPIDFATSQKMRVKVWSPKANIPVRLALETAGGGNQVAVDANVPVANEWVELEFDFSSVYNPGLSYQRFIVFFEFVDGLAGDGSVYYFDDIKVLN